MNPPRMHFSGDKVAASSASWIRRGEVQLDLMLNQMQFQDLQQYRRVTEFLGIDGVLEGVVECVAYPGMYGEALTEVYIHVPVSEIAEQIKEEGLANAGGSVVVTLGTGSFMLDQYVFNPFKFTFSPTVYSMKHTSEGKAFFPYYNCGYWDGEYPQCSRNYWSSGCDSNTGRIHLTQGTSFKNFYGSCDPIGDSTDCGRAVSTCIYNPDPQERITIHPMLGELVAIPDLAFDSYMYYWITGLGGFPINITAQTLIENVRTDDDAAKELEDESWKRYSGLRYRAIKCDPYCAYYMAEYAFNHEDKEFVLVSSDYQEDYEDYVCEFLDCIEGSAQNYSPYIFNHRTREYEENLLSPLEADEYYHNKKTWLQHRWHACFGSCLWGASGDKACRLGCRGKETWEMWVDQEEDPSGINVGSVGKYPLYPFPFYWATKDNGSYYDLDLYIENHCTGQAVFFRWGNVRGDGCGPLSCGTAQTSTGACARPVSVTYNSWSHMNDHGCVPYNTSLGTVTYYTCIWCPGEFYIKPVRFCAGCVSLGFNSGPIACVFPVDCSGAGYYSTGVSGHRRAEWVAPEQSFGYHTEYEVSNNRYEPYCQVTTLPHLYGGTATRTSIQYSMQEGTDETYNHIIKYSTAGVCGYDKEGIPTIKHVRMFDTFDGGDFAVYIVTARADNPNEILSTESVTGKFKQKFFDTFGIAFPDAYWRETVVYDDSFAYKKEFQWRS